VSVRWVGVWQPVYTVASLLVERRKHLTVVHAEHAT